MVASVVDVVKRAGLACLSGVGLILRWRSGVSNETYSLLDTFLRLTRVPLLSSSSCSSSSLVTLEKNGVTIELLCRERLLKRV